MPVSSLKRCALAAVAVLTLTACGEIKGALDRMGGNDTSLPDSLPRMLNVSLPFQYPVALYMRLIDDSVTLRLHIDEYGRPVPESTSVAAKARHADFDSSAIRGSRELVFRPAFRNGKAVGYTVLFPIHFRIPTQPVSVDSSGR